MIFLSTSSARKMATSMATSSHVTRAPIAILPPKTVRAFGAARLPSRMHSTHCCPTGAERRQSGQAWRPHRTHETYVSRPGCRKQVGTGEPSVGSPWIPGAFKLLSGGCAWATLNRNRLEHHILCRTVLLSRLHPADPVHNITAVDHFTEDGVLSVEPGCRRYGDEELRAVGARPRVRHGEQVRPVEGEIWVNLIREAVTGPTASGAQRVATLDHEI